MGKKDYLYQQSVARKFGLFMALVNVPSPARPIALRRKHLPFLFEHEYAACDKTDGCAAMLFVDDKGYAHEFNFAFKSFSFMDNALASDAACRVGNSLFMCELAMVSLHGSSAVATCVLFDCLVHRGTPTASAPLRERLRLVRDAVDVLAHPHIVTKPFYGLDDTVTLQRAVAEAIDAEDPPHPRDGIIFTPLDPATGPTFKWKAIPTADFHTGTLDIRAHTASAENAEGLAPFEPGRINVNTRNVYSGTVVECMWEPTFREWIPMRHRAGKTANTAGVVRAVFDSIVNPVTRGMLCGTEALPHSVPEAHRRIKRDLYARAAALARGGGAGGEGLVLAELMCGGARDRGAWEAAGFDVAVGVDADAARVRAARQGKTREGSGIALFDVRDVNALDAADLGAGRFDGVSAQFALHFACSTAWAARRFLRTVAALLRPGGVFFGTCMDAQRVNALLGAAGAGAVEGEGWSIRRSPVADRVTVAYPGHPIPANASEALVDLRALEAVAEGVGLRLAELAPFAHDHPFSALNITFAFVKAGGGGVVPPGQGADEEVADAHLVWRTVRHGRPPLPLRAGSAAALRNLQAAYAAARAAVVRATEEAATPDFELSAASSRPCVWCGCSKRFDELGDRVCFCDACPVACTGWRAVPAVPAVPAPAEPALPREEFRAAVAAYSRSLAAPRSVVYDGVPANTVRVRIMDCIEPAPAPAPYALDGDDDGEKGLRFCDMPVDVLKTIFAALAPPDVGQAMLANREWCAVVRQDERATCLPANYEPVVDFTYCVAGGTLVTMADGSRVPIKDLAKGDAVAVEGGTATVACKTASAREVATWRAVRNGPCATERHPVRVDGAWVCAASIDPKFRIAGWTTTVYNLLLDAGAPSHIYFANGFPTPALGHGSADPAIAHPIFGRRGVVLARLRTLPGFADGSVIV